MASRKSKKLAAVSVTPTDLASDGVLRPDMDDVKDPYDGKYRIGAPEEILAILDKYNLNLYSRRARLEFFRHYCGGQDDHHLYDVRVPSATAKWFITTPCMCGRDRNHTTALRHIKEYNRLMSIGKWHDDADIILYSRDGRLGDGYSRFHAQADLNVTISYQFNGPASPEKIMLANVHREQSIADRCGGEFGLIQAYSTQTFEGVLKVLSKHVLTMGKEPTARFMNRTEVELLSFRYQDAYQNLYIASLKVQKKHELTNSTLVPFRKPEVMAAFVHAYRHEFPACIPNLENPDPEVDLKHTSKVRSLWVAVLVGKQDPGTPAATLRDAILRNHANNDKERMHLMRRLLSGIYTNNRIDPGHPSPKDTLKTLTLSRARSFDSRAWNSKYMLAAGVTLEDNA